MNMNLADISEGESVRLWRRRKGLTQRALAARWRSTRHHVQQMEQGARKPPRLLLVRPTLAEQCQLARWRSGLGLAHIEVRLGISRPTLLAWECQAHGKLVKFWLSEGFTFAG